MKTIMAVILALAFCGTAAAKKQPVTVSTDKFTGVTKYELNEQTTAQLGSGLGFLQIDAAAAGKDTWTYGIRVTAVTHTWLFLDGVDSILLVDGQPINLRFTKDSTSVGSDSLGVWCYENLSALVSKADLDRIANAKTLEMKFGDFEFSFNAKSIGFFRDLDAALPK